MAEPRERTAQWWLTSQDLKAEAWRKFAPPDAQAEVKRQAEREAALVEASQKPGHKLYTPITIDPPLGQGRVWRESLRDAKR